MPFREISMDLAITIRFAAPEDAGLVLRLDPGARRL